MTGPPSLYEAHGRTAATLRDLAEPAVVTRRAALARELTKLHEEVRRGTLDELAAGAEARPAKGEVVIVVAGALRRGCRPTVSLEAGRARVERLVGEGVKRSAAARLVAEETGLPRRDLFARSSVLVQLSSFSAVAAWGRAAISACSRRARVRAPLTSAPGLARLTRMRNHGPGSSAQVTAARPGSMTPSSVGPHSA